MRLHFTARLKRLTVLTDSSHHPIFSLLHLCHPTAAMAQLQGVQPTASSINENVSENTEGTRAVYARQAELIFSLIGYAVGVGNVWRFLIPDLHLRRRCIFDSLWLELTLHGRPVVRAGTGHGSIDPSWHLWDVDKDWPSMMARCRLGRNRLHLDGWSLLHHHPRLDHLLPW